MKNINKFLIALLLLIGSNAMAQNQKVWSGTSKLFGINPATNPTSTVNWSMGNTSTNSKLDSTVSGRNIFTRVTYSNATSNMVLDTVKVSETISGCISSEATKLVEVFPLPTLTLGSNQTICAGASASDFNVTISNYANISGIGTFTVSYELRAGSATGTPLGGASTATINNINSGTISIPASSFTGFTPGTTYYFVLTNFGSEISATASNPAPGNISSTAVDALPRTYTITVNPAITAPSIIAY